MPTSRPWQATHTFTLDVTSWPKSWVSLSDSSTVAPSKA
jgi:hypothetical protein